MGIRLSVLGSYPNCITMLHHPTNLIMHHFFDPFDLGAKTKLNIKIHMQIRYLHIDGPAASPRFNNMITRMDSIGIRQYMHMMEARAQDSIIHHRNTSQVRPELMETRARSENTSLSLSTVWARTKPKNAKIELGPKHTSIASNYYKNLGR